MSATFTYADPNAAWSEDLGTAAVRLGSVEGYALNADNGASDGSKLSFDDPSGTVGHSSDAIVGFKYLFVDEGSEATGNKRIYAALVGSRDYTHALGPEDSLRLGVSRHIETELRHINAVLALDLITDSDGNRPAEPVGTRLAWILNSTYLGGYVSTTTTYIAVASGQGPQMDANDYRPSGTGLQVIEDCALALGWTAFLIWNDEAATLPLLYFDDFKTSTSYSTDYRLSNVLSEIDSYPNGTVGATKTYSLANSKLHRDPVGVASKMVVPYRSGWTVQTRSTTETTYTRRALTAPTQTVKTLATANTLARRLLRDSASEADTLEGDVDLPLTHVNAFREGQVVSVHDTHAPDYSGFNSWRIIARTVRQTELTDQNYIAHLTMTPLVTSACATNLNSGATVTAGVTLEAGTTTWAHATISGWFGVYPVDTAVTTVPISNPSYANDGSTTTYSNVGQQVFRNYGTVDANWYSDLGSEQEVCSVKGTQAVGAVSWQSRAPDAIYYSHDGTTWTQATYTLSFTSVLVSPQYWVATLAAHVTARYWRLTYSQTTASMGPFNLWNWMTLGIRVYDWQIIGV